MGWFRTHTLQWFALAALVCVLGFAVLDATAQAFTEAAGVAVFVAAAIRAIGLAVRDTLAEWMVVRRGSISGMIADESSARRRRRSRARGRPVAGDGAGPASVHPTVGRPGDIPRRHR